jgi:hypothetical protein
MNTLVELSSTQHKDLKIVPDASSKLASKQHIMNLRAHEIANASTCFPVFATRNTHDGAIAFSAMTSFEVGSNLFVEADKWQPVFVPLSLQTHPVYLMQSPRDEKSYTFGILEDSEDFSTTEGIALFDEQGKPSEKLNQINTSLQASVQQDVQTHQFAKDLDELKLFKALDLNVQYDNGQLQKIQGLQTIDEERLQNLSTEELESIHKKGYLTPIHAMLVSLFQVNVLINKNNERNANNRVVQVKMEVSKEAQLV